MKPPEGVPIQIGTYRTTLPVYRSRATTEKIVAQLEACHAAVRDKVSVDTVAEALWVAYEFACEVHRLKEDQDEQDTELIRTLSDLLAQVRKTVEAYGPVDGEQE
jgi:hypothetical protein